MVKRKCEQCDNQFQAITNHRRFCAICINERKKKKARESYHAKKKNEQIAPIGSLTPCKGCKQPLRITALNKHVHKECLDEYNKMMYARTYERNRKRRKRPSKRKYTEHICAFITPEMLTDLEHLCQMNNTHTADMIRRLIKNEVKRLERMKSQWTRTVTS